MQRKIWNYFEMAGRMAISKQDRRTYLLGAIGVRGDGTMVRSMNSPSPIPNREIHAEYKLCRKLDHGATVYIARIRVGDGAFVNAKPCLACRKVLRSRRVKKVYYTIGENEYGIYFPMKDEFNAEDS
jgi:deoxycytidylate deaminase